MNKFKNTIMVATLALSFSACAYASSTAIGGTNPEPPRGRAAVTMSPMSEYVMAFLAIFGI